MSKVCPRCKRSHPAVKDAAGRVVILPHAADGKERKFGETCGAKR